MTLEELKKKIERKADWDRCPRAKELEQMKLPVIAEHFVNHGTVVRVYENGMVLYRQGEIGVVFSIWDCREYIYRGVMGENQSQCISQEYFDQCNWYIRLMLEGEDRIEENQEWSCRHRMRSYSDWKLDRIKEDVMQTDPTNVDEITRLIEQSENEYLIGRVFEEMKKLTQTEQYILKRIYADGCKQGIVANELGISQGRISQIVHSCAERMKEVIKI